MGAYRNFFKQFRLQTGSTEELNREFDLVKTAFSQVQSAIDVIDNALGITNINNVTNVNGRLLDICLSYGDQSGLASLPVPPEGSTAFYLHADTNSSVQQAASGSPGCVWEFVLPHSIPDSTVRVDCIVYYCNLTPAGAPPDDLTVNLTRNGSPVITSPNCNGFSNHKFTLGPTTGTAYSAQDTIGIFINTHEVGSGALMMTAHITA